MTSTVLHTFRLFVPRSLRRIEQRLSVVALATVMCLTLLAGMAVGAGRFVAAPLVDEGHYALLVMGSDQGPPRGGSVLEGRADALHLIVVDETREHASIVSFPRDTWVTIPGQGKHKINDALTFGPEKAVDTVESITGVQIDDWIVTGFSAFDDAVDAFGGVKVDVNKRLYDPRGAGSDLQAGRQKLSGWKSLTYARDRKSQPDGDLGRNNAQAQILIALQQQIAAEGVDTRRLVELVRILRRHSTSSISTPRLFQLAGLAATIDSDNVRHAQIPARLGTVGEASVVFMNNSAERLFEDLRDDGILQSGDADPFN